MVRGKNEQLTFGTTYLGTVWGYFEKIFGKQYLKNWLKYFEEICRNFKISRKYEEVLGTL